MPAHRLERRLVAVLALDVVAYSRLMERDEDDTFERLKAHRKEVVEPLVAAHRGRVVKLTGDGALCVFQSIVDAVECAVLIQDGMGLREAEVPEERRIRLRIGVNLGDVIHAEDGDLYGGGVNVAARLEALAPPGGVLISGTAYEHVRGKLPHGFEDLGEQALKNIEEKIRVWRAVPGAAAAAAGVTLPATPAVPERPSIAVLPFNNMSADAEQEFFADGITEDLTTHLSRMKGFFVIARNTMFTYKGRPVDVRAVGRELGVRYVLEGSVRKGGNRVRVTAQLIEAATGTHLWADSYDGKTDDIFAIQDEVTTSVIGRIGPELLTAEHRLASRKPTQNLDAWECVTRALFLCSQLSNEASRDALILLDRAVEIDPAYAQAYGMMGWVTMWRALQGWEDMAETIGRAKALLARALAADENEVWAHLGQAMMAYAIRDNELAMASTTQAIALNPNLAFAHGQLSVAHSMGGRGDEAIPHIDHALRLSPREVFLGDYWFFYALAHFQAGRYPEALRYARDAHRARPGHVYPLMVGTSAAGHLRDAATGTELLADLKACVPRLSRPMAETMAAYCDASDRTRLVEGMVKAGLT